MKLISEARGHVVYVRCPTSPPSWEAACECGYRSAKYRAEEDANADAKEHAEKAPEVKQKPSKQRAATRRKK